MGRTDLCVAADGDTWEIGPFEVEFIPTTHSVPQAVATAFHTPQGTIVHSGDFKIDLTPVDGRLTNLSRLGALADGEGIRLLLADSTNADQRGHSRSETEIGRVLHQLMYEQRGRRVIVACFASHIHRIQQLADAAVDSGRVIAPLGRSMRRNISMAREMGLLRIPDSALIDVEDVDRHEPGKVLVLCTGSQGEPMSALTLLAGQENRWLKLHPDDTVILSSHPIPGNEHAVTKVIDNLFRQGVEVIHSGVSDVHATGHAKAEELKLYQSILKPDWFVPVHGEYHHLVAHARLAETMGTPHDHIVVAEDGDRLVLDDDGLREDRPGARRVRLRPRHRRRRRNRSPGRPSDPRRRGRRVRDRLRRPEEEADRRRAADHHPGVGVRGGVGRPAVGPGRAGSGRGRQRIGRGRRGVEAGQARAQGSGQLRVGPHPASTDDRSGRARGLTPASTAPNV